MLFRLRRPQCESGIAYFSFLLFLLDSTSIAEFKKPFHYKASEVSSHGSSLAQALQMFPTMLDATNRRY